MARKPIQMPSRIPKVTNKSRTDDQIESILQQSHNPSATKPPVIQELKSGTENSLEPKLFKKLPGKTLEGRRVTVDADATVVYTHNTRNFEQKHKVNEDLLSSIRLNGGNTIPAEGRLLLDGTIEVIAGTQRRYACIQENVPLTIDVYENVSEDDAHYMAYVENYGRKDITFVAQCHYFRNRFDNLKSKGETIERFTSRYKIKASTMKEYLSYGLISSDITGKIEKQELWSARNLKQLRAVWGELANEHPELDQAGLIDKVFDDERLQTPKELLTRVQAFLKSAPKKQGARREIELPRLDGSLTTKDNKLNLTVKFKDIKADEFESRLLDFLESI